jgi:hypothetical protein
VNSGDNLFRPYLFLSRVNLITPQAKGIGCIMMCFLLWPVSSSFTQV